METSSKCGLLQQETEVIISPKSRHSSMLPSDIQSNQGMLPSSGSKLTDSSPLVDKSPKPEDSSRNHVNTGKPTISNKHEAVSSDLSELPKVQGFGDQMNESDLNNENENKDVFRGIYDFLSTFWSGTTEQQKKKETSQDWHREFLPQSQSFDCTVRVEHFGEVKELVPHEHDPKPLSIHEQPTNVYLTRSTCRKFLEDLTQDQLLPATFLASIKRLQSPNEQQENLRKQMTKSNTGGQTEEVSMY